MCFIPSNSYRSFNAEEGKNLSLLYVRLEIKVCLLLHALTHTPVARYVQHKATKISRFNQLTFQTDMKTTGPQQIIEDIKSNIL